LAKKYKAINRNIIRWCSLIHESITQTPLMEGDGKGQKRREEPCS